MEVVWRKSSYFGAGSSGGDCVEVAELGACVGVRDSKAPECGHLSISRESLVTLIGQIKTN
ncbi:DUF397 domain-containing protein [Actinomadura oligospora]|uniref:DUF397 domain-containing protein n=1 Tax=Actinomadura oligospora TaxID=111804 RepID=UPI000479121A|nr:DUF397 domain-containing protein [Actinomadura oligospora]